MLISISTAEESIFMGVMIDHGVGDMFVPKLHLIPSRNLNLASK